MDSAARFPLRMAIEREPRNLSPFSSMASAAISSPKSKQNARLPSVQMTGFHAAPTAIAPKMNMIPTQALTIKLPINPVTLPFQL